MLKENEVLDFAEKLIYNSTNCQQAINLIVEYINYLSKFNFISNTTAYKLNLLILKKYPSALTDNNRPSNSQSYSTTTSSCGSSGWKDHC